MKKKKTTKRRKVKKAKKIRRKKGSSKKDGSRYTGGTKKKKRKQTKTTSKMGRPKKTINMKQLKKLCALCCTETEIANFFEVSVDTVKNKCKESFGLTFSDIQKRYSAEAKTSLRRWMFRKAREGNVVMMIWLSKNILGFKDKHEHSGDKDNPVQLIFQGLKANDLPK